MPAEGVEWKPHEDILAFEEILRAAKIMTALGIKHIRVTGGEPLLRKGFPLFLKNLKTISGIESVTLTTNGILLNDYLDEAEKLGSCLPDAINISLDALETGQYRRITRCEKTNPKTILPLIDRLLAKKITVKINCVPVCSINEQEIIPLAALAREKNIAVRFIELMPIGSAAGLQPLSGTEIMKMIENEFGALSPFTGITGRGPASYYSLDGFTGKIGFINALSHRFCETCNRLRLTSQGFLKLCLSNNLGLDLRELLRNGAEDSELAKVITEASAKKPRSYEFSNQRCENMSRIGG